MSRAGGRDARGGKERRKGADGADDGHNDDDGDRRTKRICVDVTVLWSCDESNILLSPPFATLS